MLPIRLLMKDFCAHSFSEIYFEDFASAIILGKVKSNERFSNGAGKSTIFNAIGYVLFNEITFSKLEKIIRTGTDNCRVEFDFVSSLDKNTYRIVRSNTRKSGTDVRLFRFISQDNWEDLSQRRVSDTEKELVKIIGFNYKCFCASVLFTQAGSENNTQRDFGNLPALTPEKRKSVLREVLQLNIYSNYEKLAKLKHSQIQQEIDKQRIILSTIGDVNERKKLFKKELLNLELEEVNKNTELLKMKEFISNIQSKLDALVSKNNLSIAEFELTKNQYFSLSNQIDKYNKSIEDLNTKIVLLAKEGKEIQSSILIDETKLSKFEENKEDGNILLSEIEKIDNATSSHKINIGLINNQILEKKNSSIADEETCARCHQNIPAIHKHTWQDKIAEEIVSLNKKSEDLLSLVSSLALNKKSLLEKINSINAISKEKKELEYQIKNKKETLNNKRALYKNYSNLLQEHKSLLLEKSKEFELTNTKYQELLQIKNDAITIEINELKNLLGLRSNDEKNLSAELASIIGKKAITIHQIEEATKNIDKSLQITNEIKVLEKDLLIHSKVVQAFGSNGIPALITQSVLDELQQEANNWMAKLRPGLQLQFIVINEKSKKEQEDTLDIAYFIDGSEMEYWQLSGAQKIIASLSIKLAILFILNKRLGVNIKLMLLDEVDQALDEGSTDIFSDIIKVIQSELKVLVITHDDTLKYKFSHALMVEQDENNTSQAKLIKW